MTDQSSLESAASSLCRAKGVDWDREAPGALLPLYSGYARAVLMAIRDLDDGMLFVGVKSANNAEWVCEQMVDAALDE